MLFGRELEAEEEPVALVMAGELMVRPWPGKRVSGDAVRRAADLELVSEATSGLGLLGSELSLTESDAMASLSDVLGTGEAAFQGADFGLDSTFSQATRLAISS